MILLEQNASRQDGRMAINAMSACGYGIMILLETKEIKRSLDGGY